jgi:hypothetical protein
MWYIKQMKHSQISNTFAHIVHICNDYTIVRDKVLSIDKNISYTSQTQDCDINTAVINKSL